MSALSLVNNQHKGENGNSNNASGQSMTESLQQDNKTSNSGNRTEDVSTNPEQITVAGVARRARIVPRQEAVVEQDNTDVIDDDDDDDKKRRRRSSLLRRSLSSSSLNIPTLQSGKQLIVPSPELLQAAALEDKKKKTRNYSIIKSELAYLNFEEGDDEDDDDDNILFNIGKEKEVQKPDENDEESSKLETSKESAALVQKEDSEKVEGSLDELKLKPKTKWSATDKGSSEDGDSVTTATSASTFSSRRSLFKRAGSYTNRGSASIHHVVNPLDVTVKIVQSHGSGPDVYELLPNHTGNNRVGVMVDLQCDAFLSQVEQERKQQAFIQQNDLSNSVDRGQKRITNRVCQEVVRTVQEYWQGHFFVQVEQDNEIGYKKLSQKEALQAVYDIFQHTCHPPACVDDDIYDCLANELPQSIPATRQVATPFVNSSISSLTTTASAPASRSQSDMSVSVSTTLGHDDSMSIASHNTRSTDHYSVNPLLKAAIPVLPENEDVHKSALASLQRRKQRQYATTKISNLVTGRGLIQQKPVKTSNEPRSLSDLGVDASTKIIPRQNSSPVVAATSDASFSSFSSLPTTFAEARSRSNASSLLNASFSAPEEESIDQIESEQVVPSVIGRRRSEQPMMMQAAVRRSLAKSQLIGIDEDGDGDANSVGVNTSLQERLSSRVAADNGFRRSSNSALGLDACLLKALESNDGVDLEPYQTVQQQPEMTAALQQFQEMFASTPVNTQPTITTDEAVAAALLLHNENMRLQQQLQQQQILEQQQQQQQQQQQILEQQQQQQQLLHGRQSFTGQYQPYGNATSDTNTYQNNVSEYSTNNQIVVPATTSVRFDPVPNANQTSVRRRSSIMGRRSSRLSEFSQAMIQDFLTQLNEDETLNEDEYY